MSGVDDTTEEEAAANALSCCASCGIAEVDDVKLKQCDDCDLVRYCGDNCQQEHRSQHEAVCKERADDLREEILFKQPESSHLGDCPICYLPLPLDHDKYSLYSCCSKTICIGCSYANQVRQVEEEIEQQCPFCRHTAPETWEEAEKNLMKRVAANDPNALYNK